MHLVFGARCAGGFLNRFDLESAVLVVGLGNPLMADDGFGSAVIDALRPLGRHRGLTVAVVPDVLHLWSVWRGQWAVWMVDAVASGDVPGTIHRLEHDALLGLPVRSGSAHHLDFGVCLRWLLHANPDLSCVRFRMWGVEPAGVSIRPALSPSVTAAVAPVVREIQILAAGAAPGATS